MALSLIGSNGLNHPSVQGVIKIAQEIINQNKPLNTEILYNAARKRLKLSKRGLISIIQLLFNKRILVEGSKFTKESVISNPHRKRIYKYIKSNLGAHFSIIRDEVLSKEGGTGSAGQLIWHLELLIRFNYIKKIKVGYYTIFLPIEIEDDLGIIYFLISDPINKKILETLIEQEPIQKSEIYKLINEKREYVYYRINNLINNDIISLDEVEANKIYLYPENRENIVRILNTK